MAEWLQIREPLVNRAEGSEHGGRTHCVNRWRELRLVGVDLCPSCASLRFAKRKMFENRLKITAGCVRGVFSKH